MGKIFYILFIMSLFVGCNGSKNFNEQEKELINSSDSEETMYILQTTNETDSLFLRQKSSDIDIEKNKQELQHLIRRMRVTLAESGGVGLAAPQVGIGRNIFLFMRLDKPDNPVEAVINPQIVSHSDNIISFEGDGCLSIPDLWGITGRYQSVTVKYYNETGEFVEEEIRGYTRPDDFTAVIFQHEYDHLQGVLFTDRALEIFREEENN